MKMGREDQLLSPPPPPPAVEKKKKMKDIKNRFSKEQIRQLESMFQEETKLDPKRKLELATELGLHPRQVAIWFQNRRARWKSKHLERDYCLLKASYDKLASSFDSLNKEKQCLLKQLQKLSSALSEKPQECTHGDSHYNGDTKCSGYEGNPSLLLGEVADMEEFVGEEHDEIVNNNNSESADGFLTVLPEDWSGFDSGCFSDQSSSNLSSWWDLWP